MGYIPWTRWLRSRNSSRIETYRKRRAGTHRPILEVLEDRTLLAVLPAAIVTSAGPMIDDLTGLPVLSNIATPTAVSPSVAQDPVNANRMVVVSTDGTQLLGAFTTDGGATWNGFINTGLGLAVPTPNITDPATAAPFTRLDHPTVAIDRGSNIYITAVQHNANNTSGALVFHRYQFLFGFPIASSSDVVLQRWLGPNVDNVDPIYNPVIAVDNNLATDPSTGFVDTQAALSGGFAKGLFVAWNTNDRAPTAPYAPTAPNVFNPSVIRVMGSSDGGANWTSPQIVNDNGYIENTNNNPSISRMTTPQIVFTQGSADGATRPGQLVFVWNDFGNRTLMMNATQVDSASATNPAPDSVTFTGTTGAITEAATRLQSVTVSNGGNAVYSPGNILTVVGGTLAAGGTAATLNVTAVNGTAPQPVTAAQPQNRGSYIVVPANAVATTGQDNSATFNLTWGGTGGGTVSDQRATTIFTADVNIGSAAFTIQDLEVSLNLTHPHLNQLLVELVSPGGTVITLLRNRVNEDNQTVDVNGNTTATSGLPAAGVIDAANFGSGVVNTTFSDNAARPINDGGAVAPYTLRFRPEVGSVLPAGLRNLAGNSAQISGTWTLRVTDFNNDGTIAPAAAPVQRINSWSLKFSHLNSSAGADRGRTTNLQGGWGIDRTVGTVPDASTNPSVPEMMIAGDVGNRAVAYPRVNNASGAAGIGPGISVAVDNTIGLFSPYQGRLYIAYTALGGSADGGPANDIDVYLVSGDFNGGNITWNDPVRVNDDTAGDHFSEGIRPQFMPTVAVDQSNGAVGVMYYDGRYDATGNGNPYRVATSFSASLDGGLTFSPSTYFNQAKTAGDMLDATKTITIEPIPSNQGVTQNGALGFGDRQGLIMYAGHVVPVFSGNLNTPLAYLLTAQATIAAGPRIIDADMGYVQPLGANNPIAVDGRQTFDAFTVTFDRPINPATFGTNDITLIYKSPAGVDTTLTLSAVTPLDGPSFTLGPRTIGDAANPLATRFLVTLTTPQTLAGTYRYAIGTDIGDRSRTISATTLPATTSGSSSTSALLDQNSNAVTNEGLASTDRFAVPQSTSGLPFALPYADFSLPLMLSGPRIVSTSVPGAPASPDNRVINTTNNALDVTFDRDIQVGTFTTASIIQMIGPVGPIPLLPGSTTVTPIGAVAGLARTFRITFPTQALSGSYNITFHPTMLDTSNQGVDTNQNAGLEVLKGASATPGTVSVQYSATAIPVTLTPGATVLATLDVPDDFVIQQSALQHIRLQLKVTHQNIPDLEAQLIGPDGTIIQLFRNVGRFGSVPHANMNDTVLDDFALNLIQNSGTPIPAGPFKPQLPLSALDGKGSLGVWTLAITNHGTLSGVLDRWSLFLPKGVPSTGLAEPIADQFSASFRIFVQDPANLLTTTTWTAVGPASENFGANSSRVGGLAVDPSDPSGNTVYVAGASGGVWKTTNFYTTDPRGPVYIPLTDLGPSTSLNVGSIAIFGRSNDPNQSIIFVATGEGDTTTSGVGLLRSMDGGRTWQVLDSTNNVDVANPANPNDPDKIARMNSPARDHRFVGTTSFKVIVDPVAQSNGQVAVYMALRGNVVTGGGGIWRSLDTGKTWTRIFAGTGDATDVALAAGSRDASGNLTVLYAAFRGNGGGVFYTNNARTALTLSPMLGQAAVHPSFMNMDDQANPSGMPIPVGNSAAVPGAAGYRGRTLLAVPALTNNPLKDALYQGWVYALVINGNALGGLFVTKDYGQNWTLIRIPAIPTTPPPRTVVFGTNDETKADYDPFAAPGTGFAAGQGDYDVTLAIDPNNPFVLYIGGTTDGPPADFIRVDTTTVSDAYAMIAYDNSDPQAASAAAAIQYAGQAFAGIQTAAGGTSNATGLDIGPGEQYGTISALQPPVLDPYDANHRGYYNLLRDPVNPFNSAATLQFSNVTRFNNTGDDARWMVFGPGESGTDHHELVVMRDPLTGLTRLIYGNDQGVFTGVTLEDGTGISAIGNASLMTGPRNGNIQTLQIYYGAAQPSTLAADIAGSMFYATSQDNGFPRSDSDILHTGELNWNGPQGDGTGIATDQTGSGTVYTYAWPCCGGSNPLPTDFFIVEQPGVGTFGRTFGLIQAGDNPGGIPATGQWGFLGGSNFAVNPIDGSAIVMSSRNGVGRVFRTAGPSLGYGIQWFEIGIPGTVGAVNGFGDVDTGYKPAHAFGAPSTSAPGVNNDFIYSGSVSGRVFVTTTGGGPGQWRNLSQGLPGTQVWAISANPRIDSKEAYAVTNSGVFWMADSTAANPTWVNVTGNLFNLTLPVFGNRGDDWPTLGSLLSLAVDWRFAIPDNPANPNGPTHPVLYVGGESGVYRSTDKGATWNYAAPGINEQQTISVGAGVTSITFDYNLVAAPPLPYTPSTTAAQVQTNLRLIPALGAGGGNVTVSGPNGGPWVVTFMNQLAVVDAALLQANSVGGAVSIAETVKGVPVGGYLPNLRVTELELVLGNINPTTGFPDESAGLNMLAAYTYGRGAFALRLDNSEVAQYAINPKYGPFVTDAQAGPPGTNGIDITFSGPVDRASLSPADLTLNEVQSVAVTAPVDDFTLSFNGIDAAAPLIYSTATTAAEVQDHLVTIPALITNERQTLSIPASVASLTLTFNGAIGNPLAFSPATTAVQVRANLATIPALSGNVAVAGPDGGPFVITFNGALAGKDVPLLIASNAAVTITETQKGGPNIRVSGPAGGPYVVTFLHRLAGQDVPVLIATWNGAGSVDPAQTRQGGLIGLLDPSGNPISATSVTELSTGVPNPHDRFRIDLPTPVAPGFYDFVLGPQLSDYSGNKMDQNENLVGGEVSDDMYIDRILYQGFANVRPTLSAGTYAFTPSILEDDFTNLGGDLATWIATLGANIGDPNDPSYVPNAAPRGIAITGVSNAGGRWQYTFDLYDSNPFWFEFNAISPTNALLLEANSATRLRFIPNVDVTSDPPFVSPTFTFVAWDLTAGRPGEFLNVTGGGATSSYSATTATAELTITPINDRPVHLAGAPADIVVDEDSATVTAVSLGFGGLDYAAGPATALDELAAQTLTYTITAIPAVIEVYLADGVTQVFAGVPLGSGAAGLAALQGLTFKTVADLSGEGDLIWTIVDDGGTALGGVDTLTESIHITVNPLNDVPVQNGTAPTAIEINEDSHNVTAVSLGLGGLSYLPGPASALDEAGQTLTYRLTVVPAFMAVFRADGVTAVPAGTTLGSGAAGLAILQGLTYKTLVDRNGVGNLTWTVTDDGQSGNPLVNDFMTLTETLSITVNPINDAPVRTAPAALTPVNVNEDSANVTAAAVGLAGVNYAAGPVTATDETGQTLTYVVTAIPAFVTLYLNDGVTVVTAGTNLGSGAVGLTALRGLRYKTLLDVNGAGTLSWTVTDDGQSGNPLVDDFQTLTQNLSITVNAVNDAPVLTGTAPAPITVDEDSNNVAAISLGMGALDYATAPATAVDEVAQTLSYRVTVVPSFIQVFLADGVTAVPAGTLLADLAALQGLTFKTTPDISGVGNLTWTVTDNGSGTAPNVNTLTQTLLITVVPFNDPPVRTAPAALTAVVVDEDAANSIAATLGLGAVSYSPGPVTASDEATQVLTYRVTAIPAFIQVFLNDGVTQVTAPTTLGSGAAGLAALRGLRFKTLVDQNGVGDLTWTVTDNGQSGSPLVNDFLTITENLSITVNAVNDAPVQNGTAPTPISVIEDAHNLTAVSLGMNGLSYLPGPATAADEVGQNLSYTLTAVPSFIKVYLSDGTTEVTAGTLLADLTALRGLTYKTLLDQNGVGNVTWTVTDDGPSGAPNVNTLSQSLSVTVSAVNDAPIVTGTAPTPIIVNEDSHNTVAVGLGLGGLDYLPGPLTAGDELGSQTLTYRLTVVPSFIAVFLADGVTAVPANTVLTGLANLRGLTYKTLVDRNGSGLLTWTVTDSGSGTAPNVNSITESLSITVNAVNDAPVATGAAPTPVNVLEDAHNVTAASLGMAGLNYTPGPATATDETAQTLTYTITGIPAFIKVFLSDGVSEVTASTVLANLTALRGLTYKTLLDQNGTGNLTWTVVDSGLGAAPDVNTLAQSLAITVNAVNDAPLQVGTPPTPIVVDEDAHDLTAASLGLGGLDYVPGPAAATDEAIQTLTYTITGIPAFVKLYLSDGTTEVTVGAVLADLTALRGLTYKTLLDQNGSGLLTWTVTDSGSGTAPNVNILSQSLSITVNAVNDMPVRTSAAPAAVSVDEDSANVSAVSLGLGALSYAAGPGTATDELGSQTLSYRVTATPTFIKVLLADGVTEVTAGTVLANLAALRGLTFKTLLDQNGSGVLTWTVTDSGSGTAPHINQLEQTLTITVNAVNDVPIQTGIAPNPISVNEDAQNSTAATLGLLSLNYVPGPATATDEATQTLTYTVTAIPSFLKVYLSDGVTEVPAGTVLADLAALRGLTYRTLLDQNGAGNLTWTATDSGPGAPPNVNSLAQSLSITVAAVNDAPVQVGIAPPAINVNEDSHNAVAVGLGLDGLDYLAGPATAGDELATQMLTYRITAIPAFVRVYLADGVTQVVAGTTLANLPTLRGLTYKTLPELNGSGDFSWQVIDDGSSTSPHVSTLNQSMTITVQAVNDAPSFTKGPNLFLTKNAATQTLVGWATSISPDQYFPPNPNEAGQTLNFLVSNDNNGLFAIPPALNAAGTLVFTPAANVAGTALVTVLLRDNGGMDFGGVDTSPAQTFTITLSGETSTTLTLPASSTFGELVTFNAQVIPVVGSPNALLGQTVAFRDGVNFLGTGNLDATGRASFSTSALTAGDHHITASFVGDLHYDASDSLTQLFQVAKAPTTVILAQTPNTASLFVGQTVTYTATVNVLGPGSGTPTGTVTFLIDGNPIIGLDPVPLNGNQASFTTDAIPLGTRTISARFTNADGNFEGSDSLGRIVLIKPNPIVFAIVPVSAKSGAAFTVKVQYLNGIVPDPSFRELVTVEIASGPADSRLTGITTVRAVAGVATFSNLRLDRAGDYTLKTVVAGVPDVVSTTITVTASSLTAQVVPAKPFINEAITITVTARDITGNVATNFNGPFTMVVKSKPSGAQVSNLSGTFTNGIGSVPNLLVSKAGKYKFQITVNGVTLLITLSIAGRRR